MTTASRPLQVLGLVLLAAAGLVAGCDRSGASDADGEGWYEERASKTDGTGRFYLDREIAPVMGHPQGREWLERPTREQQELPGRIVQALELDPSSVVADIGTGTGYMAFRVAPHVPYGTVYAVDIQSEMLEDVRARAAADGVENVVPVLGTERDPNLPAGRVDVAVMVDAYHEFSYPREMMTNVVQALRPGGRVVLVEYRGEDATLPIEPLHRMTIEQARREMEAVGLTFAGTRDILPQQHFMIFRKPARGVDG